MKKSSTVFIVRTSCCSIVNYCYILIDNESKEILLVDPAWKFNTIKKAVNNINGKVKYVLLTHSHFDHINLADAVAKEYNAKVFMSDIEINDYKFRCNNLNSIHDNDEIYLGNTKIECILTPGHTSGSMCYYADGNLFTGDTVFIEGCGMCNTPGGSAEKMYYSIKRLINIIPKETLIYPAHSYGKRVGYDMQYLLKNNIYFNIDNIDQFISFRMRRGQHGLFDFK